MALIFKEKFVIIYLYYNINMKYTIASYIRSAGYIIKAGLVDHAKKELSQAGLFDKNSDYGGLIGKAVMELVKCFSNQGHSGFSATWVLDLFNRLGRYKTLTPITNDPKEWMEVSENLWQSKRNPALFSENNGKTYYDVDDKKRLKTRSKKHQGKGKPSIFLRTIYRVPTKEELIEVDSFNLSPDEIYDGFCYTIVGRGIMMQDKKDTIIESIKMLNEMFPGKYKKALEKAKEIELRKRSP